MSGLISYTAFGMTTGNLGGVPAFAARRNGTVSGAGTEVVFPEAQHNFGGHYSTSTGRFTAPVSGSYYFSLAARHNSGQNGMADIKVDGSGSYLLVRLEYPSSYPNYSQNEVSIVYFLERGQYVSCWVTSNQMHWDQQWYAGFRGHMVCPQ